MDGRNGKKCWKKRRDRRKCRGIECAKQEIMRWINGCVRLRRDRTKRFTIVQKVFGKAISKEITEEEQLCHGEPGSGLHIGKVGSGDHPCILVTRDLCGT